MIEPSEYEKIYGYIETYEKIGIVGHTDPDGDCIGSQLAFADFWRDRGKEVYLFSPGPFNRPEIDDKESLFLQSTPEDFVSGNCVVLIVDSSTSDRLGQFKAELAGLPSVVFDHHTGNTFQSEHACIDSSYPSTSLIIQEFIEANGGTLTPEIAENIFFGFVTDTGFFHHLEPHHARFLGHIGRLLETGVSPSDSHHRMYGNRDHTSRRALAHVLAKCTRLGGGAVILARFSHRDKHRFGVKKLDTEPLYDILKNTRGCEIVILIKEDYRRLCSVSMRSWSHDVASIARAFGGGGHEHAAGFTFQGTIGAVEKNLIPIVESAFRSGQSVN